MGLRPRTNHRDARRAPRLISGIVVAGLLAMASACGGGSSSGGKQKGAGTLDFLTASPSAAMLRDVGSTVDLEITGISTTKKKTDLTAASRGTTYVSSDPNVAVMTMNGRVIRVGPGTATITVTNGTTTLMVAVYSDDALALSDGDFDFALGMGPADAGGTLEVPVLLEVGANDFGAYRTKVTFDAAQFEYVKVKPGADVKKPLAVRTDVAGEVEFLGAYDAGSGQAATGTIEIARLVLRATGVPGDASKITGEALEVFDSTFPAIAIGPVTPRPFVAGDRWLPIE